MFIMQEYKGVAPSKKVVHFTHVELSYGRVESTVLVILKKSTFIQQCLTWLQASVGV